MGSKRLGFVEITRDLLAAKLGLPPDADIREIKLKWEDETLMVKFSSVECPEILEGDAIPRVNGLMDKY